MTISNPSKAWILYLRVPDAGIAQVNDYQRELQLRNGSNKDIKVEFYLDGNPSILYDGTLVDVDPDQQKLNDQNPESSQLVLIRVNFDKKVLGLKDGVDGLIDQQSLSLQGAAATAVIHCGKTNNLTFYCRPWYHEFLKTKFGL